MFRAEFKRNWHESLVYYPDFLSNFLMTVILFMMFMLLGNQSVSDNYVGYAFWFLLGGVISEASISISYEKQIGTFEQLILKPISLIKVLFIKSIIWGIFNFVQVLIATLILSFIFPLKLEISWFTLLVFIVNFFAIIGFSMIFSGLTLKFTKTASFNTIIEYVLLFASGALIPLNHMPEILKIFATILPMNLGLKLSQSSFSLVPFLLLLFQAVAYLTVGSLAFHFVYNRAKKAGLNCQSKQKMSR